MMKPGTIIMGPNGQGYKLLHKICKGHKPYARLFEPFGGAPVPVKGDPMPDWLQDALKPLRLTYDVL